jgi:predicted O-methyltransferase YrrM
MSSRFLGRGRRTTSGRRDFDYPVRPVPRYGYGKPAHARLERLIAAGSEDYRIRLESFLDFRHDLLQIPLDPADPETPSWHNGWFQGLDAVALYALLAQTKPSRYVEIGSGFSTKFARRAIRDQQLPTRIISIDPSPRSAVDALCDEVIRTPIEDAHLDATLGRLTAGDVLFLDGSHRCFQNSDVSVVFLEVLPELEPGVLVHFHDIFLPWDYPPQMADRYYSEQYLLATALLSDRSLEVLLPNFFVSIRPDLHRVLSPLWDAFTWSATPTNGLSFWIRRG